jgi:uncharacterized membrane protein YjjP (DUF1212 family)
VLLRSGADVQRIQNMMGTLVRESEMKNIEVTFEALKAFYQVCDKGRSRNDA